MKPETRIVDQIMMWVFEQGGEVLKLHGSAMQRSGEPDLIGAVDSKPFVYEVKLPGEQPREDQIYRLERWARVGFRAGWGTSLKDFEEFIYAENNGMVAAPSSRI